MFEELKKDKNLVRILLILLIIAVGSYVFNIFSDVLGNFSDVFIILIAAWLVSFILEPMAEKIHDLLRISKTIATLIVFVGITLLTVVTIFLFIPEITKQIETMIKILPGYLNSTPQFIRNFGNGVISSLNLSATILPSVASVLVSIFVVLILSFYFIIDKERINAEFYDLIPKKWHTRVHLIQGIITNVFASFLRVQLAFGILTGIITWIILRILGIEFAASTAVLAGLLAVIPLIGPVLGVIPPVFVAFLEDPVKAIIVLAALAVIQQFVFNVIGPKLLGRAFKIHPAIVLLSFVIGAKIAGFLGAIFAVPVLGIIALLIRKLNRDFFKLEK